MFSFYDTADLSERQRIAANSSETKVSQASNSHRALNEDVSSYSTCMLSPINAVYVPVAFVGRDPEF